MGRPACMGDHHRPCDKEHGEDCLLQCLATQALPCWWWWSLSSLTRLSPPLSTLRDLGLRRITCSELLGGSSQNFSHLSSGSREACLMPREGLSLPLSTSRLGWSRPSYAWSQGWWGPRPTLPGASSGQ